MYLKYRYKYAFDHFMLHDCWMCVLYNIQMLTNSFWLSLLARKKEIECHNNDRERHSLVCISNNSIINYLLLTFYWFCFRILFVNNIRIRNNVANKQLQHSVCVCVCVSVIFLLLFWYKTKWPSGHKSGEFKKNANTHYDVFGVVRQTLYRSFTSIYILYCWTSFRRRKSKLRCKVAQTFLKVTQVEAKTLISFISFFETNNAMYRMNSV